MSYFGDLPNIDNVMAAGRGSVYDAIGNKGLVLRKQIGAIARIVNSLSPIGSQPRTENDFRPQRDNLWDFVLPDIKSGVHTISGIDVMKYCQQVKFKPYKIKDKHVIKYGPFQRSYPGALSVDNISATFICSTPDIVGVYLRSWLNAVVDERGFYSPKINYVRKASVVLYNKSGQINTQFDLNGLFPLSVGNYDLAYSGTSYVKYEVEFSVDTVIPKNAANMNT